MGGACVKAGAAQWALLYEKNPELYRYHERREQEFREFIESADLRPLRSGPEQVALDRKQGTCPRDGNDLTRVSSAQKRDLVTDVCPACRGIWLDGGELKKLLESSS